MIYNLTFEKSLINVFIQHFLQHYSIKNNDFSQYTIFLPSMRLVNIFKNELLNATFNKAILSPHIISINNFNHIIDPNNHLHTNEDFKKDHDQLLANTISIRERCFILSTLIRKLKPKITLYHSIQIANELGQLIDKSYNEQLNFNSIEQLIDTNLSQHWQENLKFLKIITEYWPQFLLDNKVADVNQQQNLKYQIQAKIWHYDQPKNIFILNIQSYNQNILQLLKSINNNQDNELWFYGLNMPLLKQLFNNQSTIEPHDEQYINHYMLKQLKIDLQDIHEYTDNQYYLHNIFDNNLTLNQVTQQYANQLANKISILTHNQEEEEAQTISIIIRHTLETPHQTIGIICNNLQLIKRIKANLKKWNLEPDDAIGNALTTNLNTQFFLLVGDALLNNFNPSSLLALLRHSYFNLKGYNKYQLDELTNILDTKIMRLPTKITSFKDYIKNIKNLKYLNSHNAIKKSDLLALIDTLQQLTAPYQLNKRKITFQELLINHIQLAEQLCIINNECILWNQQAGKELSLALATLIQESHHLPYINQLNIRDYLPIINDEIQKITIRSIHNAHPRIKLYNSNQAILTQHDKIIISNLNETHNPTKLINNIWCNNHLLQQLGFQSSKINLGIELNHFLSFLGHTEIILTRSEKNLNGDITLASRWLLQLELFFKYTLQINDITLLPNKANYLAHISKHIFHVKDVNIINPNNFCANLPINKRPKNLTATAIDKLINNPYVYYIENILQLKPLDDINLDYTKNALFFGNNIHIALEKFFQTSLNTNHLNTQIEQLHNLIKQQFDDINTITFKLFKEPIFYNIAAQIINHYHIIKANKNIQYIATEIKGCLSIPLNNQLSIELVAKSDRIDLYDDQTATIIDYKTKSISNNQTVLKNNNYVHQLPINALILYKNGFEKLLKNSHTLTSINIEYIYLASNRVQHIKPYTETLSQQCILNYQEELITILHDYYINGIPYELKQDAYLAEHMKYFLRYPKINSALNNNHDD